ncbi:hypothetical protein [Blastopirellula marina]|uniref:Uncharacterized protein n=1 Tax=Blastopirellula marina DSM 3645 TaxID=314230 RepID=A3ZP33_9BACT|nr:hypothetical protein [Blastopirellula marina]EAQ81507.1 hypothetical protein DSM3645_28037 [Blastopirellula marina DSM 3645]
MQYKTIVMEMLEFRPGIKEHLPIEENPLETLDRLATELKTLHETYKEQLARTRTDSHPVLISSEALEMALQELEDRLLPASSADEPEALSLDRAMAFIRRHTLKK